MLLSDLLGGTPSPGDKFADLEITGVSCDSRKTGPGHLFFAVKGSHADGRDYVGDALKRGAVAVATDNRKPGASLDGLAKKGVALVRFESPRREMALAASRFWAKQPGMVAAVTGTNGKTSTVEFLRQIWRRATWQAASIGTLGLVWDDADEGERALPGLGALTTLTTPDPLSLHAAIDPLARSGVTHLAIEASSHGIGQNRLDGLGVHVAAFTNLTRDHLDHHGDMDAYFEAKAGLFERVLLPGGTAVVNIDDPQGAKLVKRLAKSCPNRHVVLTVGKDKGADFAIGDVATMDFGLDVSLRHNGTDYRIPMALAGSFQAMNAVTAAVMAHASGLAVHDTLGALAYVTGAEGRMQLVPGHPGGARIIVDYAHTPDALHAVLSTLRAEATGKLAVLFGAGGERDKGKRPMMGRVAHEGADMVFVTDDNPRGEDAGAIRSEILEACPNAVEIADRGKAIAAAMERVGAGDVLLIAGKGHENVQLVGDETLPFSDSSVARAAIGRITAEESRT